MIGWFGVPYQTLRRATCQPAGCFEEFGPGPVGTACVADRFTLLFAESDLHGDGAALLVGERRASGTRVHGFDYRGLQKTLGRVLRATTYEGYIKSVSKSQRSPR